MKLLKYLATCAFVIASLGSSAQIDLKINAPNLLFYETNVSAEFVLSPNLSVSAFTSFVYDFPSTYEESFVNKNFYFGPELRYYVNPKTNADGFFIGVYAKQVFGTVQLGDYYDNNSIYAPLPIGIADESNYNKLAAGFVGGAKWVFKSNLTMGFFGAIGRNLYTSFDDQEFGDFYYDYDDFEKYFDYRFGFNLGYRFK